MTHSVIQAIDVKKEYVMGTQTVHALRGVSFEIMKNEYVAIMGPSGSGKSTMMNVIGCLDTPSSGSYILNVTNVNTLTSHYLSSILPPSLFFFFPPFHLFPLSPSFSPFSLPLIYAGMKHSERRKRAIEVLDRVGLADRMDHKPNELSGGQRQRVAVARALVNNPSILLADEPTGNLDSKTGIEIMQLFEELHAQGNTIILVTHEEDIAMHAHRIIRLRDGLLESDKLRDKAHHAEHSHA